MNKPLQSGTVAETLAAFAIGSARDPALVGSDTTARAAERLLDNIGAALFGLQIEPARRIATLAAELGQGPCHVLGHPATTSATGAALAHGTLIQSFEMNDLGVYVHPGACIVPACLAAMDHVGGRVSGAALLNAMIVGYEVTIRLSECVGPRPELDVGWHTPPFHGAVGAAVAASLLLGSDQQTVAQALVIAADIAGGGLMLARLGSDVKRLHCGRGAEAGVLAALLARQGLRSRLDTLEHKDWGYCRTMTASPDGFDLDVIAQGLGETFVGFSRTAVKYYPVGAEVLGVVDNIGSLKTRHGVRADDVEKVTVGTPRFFVKAEAHEFPKSVSHVHFNVEYGAAMALLHDVRPVFEGRQVLHQWLEGYRKPEVRDLASRIHHVVDEDLDRQNPYSVDSRVEITLRDGTVLREASSYVRDAESKGTMSFAPMSEDRIVRKFRALSEVVLEEDEQERVIEAVLGMADLHDAAAFWRALNASLRPVTARYS